jgi:peptide/nickel transport system substrate-binding protein
MFLFSCNINQNSESNQKEKPEIISFYTFGNITSLDPIHVVNSDHANLCGLIFNGLVQTDQEMDIIPCIARRYEYDEKENKYTFYLRNDVYFHDDSCFLDGKGRKVKADDFIYSFNRAYKQCYEQIKNVFDFFICDTIKKELLGLRSLNDSVLEIRLQKPCVFFLKVLTLKIFSVIPHEALEFYKENILNHAVGTGPFILKKWDKKEKVILLKANKKYFEKDRDGFALPYADGVIFRYKCDRRNANLDMLNNKVDIMTENLENNNDLFEKDGSLQSNYAKIMTVHRNKELMLQYLGFLVNPNLDGSRNSPALNKNIRKAIHFAIDRNKLVTLLLNKSGLPVTNGFIPEFLYPALSANLHSVNYFNPDSAKYYLAKAGFPSGKGMPVLNIHGPDRTKNLLEYIQTELKNVGMNVKIKIEPNENFQSKIKLGLFPAFIRSWTYDYNDDYSLFSIFYSKNKPPFGFNYTWFYNKEFDKLFESSMGNSENRFNLFNNMNNILMDEMPVVPLYYKESIVLIHKNISGFQMNMLDFIDFRYIRKLEN